MHTHTHGLTFAAGLLASCLLAAGLASAQDAPPEASVDGKYSDLLKILDVPQDEETYGKTFEWGYWTGQTWGDHKDLPTAYWVYVAPKWYLWAKQLKREADELPPVVSLNGKYAGLLQTLRVPADEKAYGTFRDYGKWDGTLYANHHPLPPAYWVYLAPNWYLWEYARPVEPPAAPLVDDPLPDESKLPVEASANGKYAKLLKILNVPEDESNEGRFKDAGFSNLTRYGDYKNLPRGSYWVYATPKWYLWGTFRRAPARPAPPPEASLQGKYADLITTLEVPADEAKHGKFQELGRSAQTSYAGREQLPAGAYWIYLAPRWYLWARKFEANP